MGKLKLTRFLLLIPALMLSACIFVNPEETSEQIPIQQTDFSEYFENADTDIEEIIEHWPEVDPFLRARILADMLYEARIAFEDNRLLLPAGNNAYDRYLEVLSIESENQVALDGIESIADRYVEMANEAIRIGQFDNAENYLSRAASINPNKENIAEARRSMVQDSQIRRDYFPLNPQELNTQSLAIMSRLGDIAEYVRIREATFLITARTDAEGRWIYRIMREATGGYRLRGNIVIGTQPTIQVNIPQT